VLEVSPVERDPMVIPEIVTKTGAPAAMVPSFNTITIDSELGGATVAKTPPLIETVGDEFDEKNPKGKKRMMLLLMDSSPPGEGEKENITAEPILPALRSPLEILNEKFATRSPIRPDEVPKDKMSSALVETKRSGDDTAGLGGEPMTAPNNVTETVLWGTKAEYDVLIIMQVDVKEIADPIAPLLIEIEGVMLLLKKLRGKTIDIKPPVNNSWIMKKETVAEMLSFPDIRSETGT
jgi:hypothetical protein